MRMLRPTLSVLGLAVAGLSLQAAGSFSTSPAARPVPAPAAPVAATAADTPDTPGTTSPTTPNPYGFDAAAPAPRSAGALAWGPDRVLFVGDTAGGAIHALETPAAPADSSTEGLKIEEIDKKVAALLGTTPDQIVFRDMKTHRASQAVYLSVMNGRDARAVPVLIRATRDGRLTQVPYADAPHATLSLANAPAADAKTAWGDSARTLSITSLGYFDGRLYAAGLSNEEFASDLRVAPFPFTGKADATSVEVFHTAHDRFETQAPIQAFMPFSIKGTPSLLASYTCSPLAAFRLDELKPGTKVRGRTLAELGGGNRPLDMIGVTIQGQSLVIIANNNRTLMKLRAGDIEAAPALTQGVPATYATAGVPYISVAQVGVLQLDDFNADWILLLQRHIESGALNLTTFPKKWLL